MELVYNTGATEGEWQERNSMIDEINKKGYVLRKQAEFLMDFDRKYRCCNRCGKTIKETKGWMVVKAPDRRGTQRDVGLAEMCFACQMLDMLEHRNEIMGITEVEK